MHSMHHAGEQANTSRALTASHGIIICVPVEWVRCSLHLERYWLRLLQPVQSRLVEGRVPCGDVAVAVAVAEGIGWLPRSVGA